MTGRRIRLDELLVRLGLETSRSRARARILAGEVRLDGRVLDKAGALVLADAHPELVERPRYVSRGGEKLAGALAAFQLDPTGWRCADVGASTGGFTDCLLKAGARSVLAVDVGYGQLAYELRCDPRVRVFERTNIRSFELPGDEEPCDLVTADLAFISLGKVLPQLVALARPQGQLLLLVKPQFELSRGEVGRGGVVLDLSLRLEAAARVRNEAEGLGFSCLGEEESVLPGPKGNRERFVLLRARP